MQFKIFEKHNLIQGVSNISLGSVKKKFEKRAIKFLKSLGYKEIYPENLIWAEQVFGPNVHICRKKDSGKSIKNADGLISGIPQKILSIFTADCIPVLLFDRKQKVVAALHGGRECLIRGIIKNTIDKMISNFNSKTEDILAGIGPHIRKCHYWLLPKTYHNLKKTSFKKYFLKKKGKIYFDLTGLIFDELVKAGLKKKNIEDCQICTYCQYKKYFSARKQEKFPKIYKEKKSRITSFIGLAKP